MHLADRLDLPTGLTARPYRGRADHPAMAELLTAYRRAKGDPESVRAEHMDQSYAELTDCDPELDIAIVEDAADLVGYCRPTHGPVPDGFHDLVVFAPVHPDRHGRDLFDRIIGAEEEHLLKWLDGDAPGRYRGYAGHPGPDGAPTGEAAWFERRGYRTAHWSASLLRSHLDAVPDVPLPDGIELRPVEPDQMEHIVREHNLCFSEDWDYDPEQATDTSYIVDDPDRDETLWQVAWHGDRVVSQVKPFINEVENDERGYRRGYTEYISTHPDYRNRGIAKALLARALVAIRDRGMTEAVLGVDTNNPGGAFQLYQGLGFEVQSYEAVYKRPVDRSSA
ncbi:MAG: N-acetyltransferase [Actinomycetota bacterium]